MKKINLYFLILISFYAYKSNGQIIQINDPNTTESGFSLQELVENVLIASDCATVDSFSEQVSGQPSDNETKSYGYFERPLGSNFPFEKGIILTTGRAFAAGNSVNNLIPFPNFVNGAPGDLDLEAALGQGFTFDATFIKFNFVPNSNTISFRFLMASEEYDGNTECDYADSFAFLLRPLGETNYTNLAVLPNGTPVSVTNINAASTLGLGTCDANQAFFEGYNLGATNYGGRTIVLTANAEVIPNQTYEIKLVVADQGDSSWDSAIFLEAGSFNIGLDLGEDLTLTGGNPACSDTPLILDTEIPTTTASHIWFLDGVEIAGETNSTLNVTTDGTYSVELEYGTNCTARDTILIEFTDSPTANAVANQFICDTDNDGFWDLDLNALNTTVLGPQSDSEFTISYHSSQEDADNNNSPLSSPYTNQNSYELETIFVRIESNNNALCFDTTSFDFDVFDAPTTDAITYELCDNTDDGSDTNGIVEFDLSTLNEQVLGTQDPGQFNISFHLNQTDADNRASALPLLYPNTVADLQEIIVRLENADNRDCYDTAIITLVVNPLPVILSSPATLTQCDTDVDGISDFNLTEANILLSSDYLNEEFTYYLTPEDAETGLPADRIANPTSYTNPTALNSKVFARIETVKGCYRTAQIDLIVSATQIPADFMLSYVVCDDDSVDGDDNNGISTFDFSDATAQIEALFPIGQNLTITYYTNEEDALAETNAISDITNHRNNGSPNIQNIFIRVDNDDVNACLGLGEHITLMVNPLPNNNSVDDFEVCSSVPNIAEINLEETFNSTILGTQNQDDYIVSYHESQEHADNNIEPKVGDYTNSNNPQTIYVRIENKNTNCVRTTINFDIVVFDSPSFVAPSPYLLCDDDVADGLTQFDLSSKIDEISDGDSDKVITFHSSQADADDNINPLNSLFTNTVAPQQTLYVRIEDNATTITGCYSTTTLLLDVKSLPVVNALSPLQSCDADNNGFVEFNLADADAEVTGEVANIIASYHATLDDANNGENALLSPYTNTTINSQVIYARAENTVTGCYTVEELELIASPTPVLQPTLDTYVLCDDEDSNDGLRPFDLTTKDETVLGSQSASDFNITYHLSRTDASTATNPINNVENYTNISNPQTIYVRLESRANGCAKTSEFILETNPLPLRVLPTTLEICDDDFFEDADGIATFDLTIKNLEITNSNSNWEVRYYETDADAQSNENVIDPATSYTNRAIGLNPANPQTIYVRVTNTNTGCYNFTTLQIEVLPNPIPKQDAPTIELCDDTSTGDIQEVFDLTQNEAYILNGEANVSARYFEQMDDAIANNINNAIDIPQEYSNIEEDQTIYVRVTNTITDCFTVVSFNIRVNPLPLDTQIDNFFICEIETDGVASFDFSDKTTEILNGRDPSIFRVTYHETPNDAELPDNEIPTPYDNLSNPQEIFVNITNTNTGCDNSTMSFTIGVGEASDANPDMIPIEYALCNTILDTDGDQTNNFLQFDLSTQNEFVLDGQDPSIYSVNYFETEPDAESGIDPLPLQYINKINPQIIYARVDYTLATNKQFCYAITKLTLKVNPLPEFDLENEYVLCINTNGTEVISQPILSTGLSEEDYTFEWTDASGTIISSASSYEPTQGGVYNVLVTDRITGCSNTDSALVNESEPPVVSAEVTTLPFANQHDILVTATGGGISNFEYRLDYGPWQEDGLFTNVSRGEHVITVRDKNGCGEQMVKVMVIDYPVYFTPNNDGYNDKWNIYSLINQNNVKIHIFDRYGKLLKQISPKGEGWDGTVNGAALPSSDYWFIVEFEDPISGAMKQFKSHFTLKR